jgi:hypothetical protein
MPNNELYFDYLNDLRESGVTNMFGAGAYLEDEFGLDSEEAKNILVAWMSSFNEESKDEEPVEPEVVITQTTADPEPERLDSLPQDTQYPDGNVYAKHTKDGTFQVSHTTKKRAYFSAGQTKRFASFDHIEYYLINK